MNIYRSLCGIIYVIVDVHSSEEEMLYITAMSIVVLWWFVPHLLLSIHNTQHMYHVHSHIRWPPPYEHPHPTTYRYATSCSQFHLISICRTVYSDCLVGCSYNYVLCCIYPPLPPSPKCLTFHLTSPIRTQTFTLLVLAQEYVYLHLMYMLSRSAHYMSSCPYHASPHHPFAYHWQVMYTEQLWHKRIEGTRIGRIMTLIRPVKRFILYKLFRSNWYNLTYIGKRKSDVQ